MAVVDPGGVPDCPDAAVLAFPDFIDDVEVSASLFAAVEERARYRGARRVLGPMNPDIHHDVGIQIRGHDRRNAVFMGFQPPYYQRHFEETGGFRPLADFDAWVLDRHSFIADGTLHRLARRVERRQPLRIRPVNLARFGDELALFHRLYAEAFAGHWGFSPPTWEEFKFIAADLRYILRGRMALVAELAGEPAGFVLGIPDLYAILPKGSKGRLTPGFLVATLQRWRQVDEARVMIAGVLPRFRRHGIHFPLFERVAQEIFALGFRGGEISWVMAGNRGMMKALPLLGASVAKTYRIYIKPLHQ
jgi:GNAT superfamily N-acetyltransferase